MLDPNARQLYLEVLRPPEEYQFDRALATTFSLNLLTLLMVPFSLAMFEHERTAETLGNPIALLEALRRTANKLSVFCQRGQIAVPPADQLLYSYLEPMVVEVLLPNHPSGVFHPKIWLMRFVAEDRPTIYRFLCLSRNLTFDKSWDTVLALEGAVQQRKVGYSRNRPLSDFIAHLPQLACVPVSDRIEQDIELLSDEVRRVAFEPPSGFKDEIVFHPVGIPGYRRFSIKGHVDRLLIVSPFLSRQILIRLTSNGGQHVLVSRVASLDEELRERERARFSEILVMDEAAARTEETDEEATEETETGKTDGAELGDFGLSGLHAKLYLAKAGRNARLWTGSANATSAAFSGRNVEFMVELKGSHSKIGIDKVLEQDDHRINFRDLLKNYMPPKEPQSGDSEQRQLEGQVESVRRELTALDMRLAVQQGAADGLYDLILMVASNRPYTFTEEVEGRCWPITLQQGYAKDLISLLNTKQVVFGGISTASVTSFLAFELTLRSGNLKHSARFVLNLPMEDVPEDRDECILRNILSDQSNFLRYLLFLLADTGVEPTWLTSPYRRTGIGVQQTLPLLSEYGLMEKLVRAYSRTPEKLDSIAELVDDLCQSPDGRQLLPEGFEELWRTIWRARLEAKP
jgi:hypothetical protein